MSATQSWWDTPPSRPPADGKDSKLEFEKMDLSSFPEDPEEELLTRRIHVYGTGSIGTLVAHSLALLPNPPPITLMLHRPDLYEEFKQRARIVRRFDKNTEIIDEQSGFDIDIKEVDQASTFWKHIPHQKDDSRAPLNPLDQAEKLENGEVFIYNLIVAVKGPATVQALKDIKHRVDSRTTIVFMQNGMGQIDALNTQVFTDPTTRPTYMLGIVSHGCYMQRSFTVVHAGFGTIALGINRDTDKFPLPPKALDALTSTNTSSTSSATPSKPSSLLPSQRQTMFPSEKDLYANLSSRYLLRTLTRSTVLACAAYPFLDLLQLQLEKLVSNCVLNPLTALLNVPNGDMLDNQPLTRVQRLLIAEISLVIRTMPELEGIPNVQSRFSARRLESFFQGICERTAKNSSSMREDVRHAKQTEIEFINGYIVRRGEELGIKCVLNYMIMQLIKATTDLQWKSGLVSVPYGVTDQKAKIQGDAVVLEEVEGREAEAVLWKPL